MKESVPLHYYSEHLLMFITGHDKVLGKNSVPSSVHCIFFYYRLVLYNDGPVLLDAYPHLAKQGMRALIQFATTQLCEHRGFGACCN
jgi:hypothetical protein